MDIKTLYTAEQIQEAVARTARKIENRFGFPHCVTVNGETCQPVEVRDEDWELLRETARRGYIQIRQKEL